MQNNKIAILGKNYHILDVIEHITIADSFVLRNKIGPAHGEAKLYLGPRESRESFYKDFFNNFKNAYGFFIKSDLDSYLEDAKFEYEEQEQGYKKDISIFWEENKQKVKKLKDIEYFSISESPAGGTSRFYLANPSEEVFKTFRQIMIPVITYITIIKLQEITTKNIFFYFRPFLDYYYDKRNFLERLEAKNKPKSPELKAAREGQGKYRLSVIEEFNSTCLITKINDERLLIASHIKPWVMSNNSEKLDRYNGLLLSPTYDRLFDQGFITFNSGGVISTSPYISPMNWKRLNLKNNQKFNLPYNLTRAKYLEFHQKKIFKGMT